MNKKEKGAGEARMKATKPKKGKRFYIGKGCIVYERTGKQTFDEPAGVFQNRKFAKIFCDVMNNRWEEEQRKLNAPACGNDGTKWSRLHCEYVDDKCVYCGEEIPY